MRLDETNNYPETEDEYPTLEVCECGLIKLEDGSCPGRCQFHSRQHIAEIVPDEGKFRLEDVRDIQELDEG